MTQLTKTDLQTQKQATTSARPAALVKFDREIKLPVGIDKTKFMLAASTLFTKVRDIQNCSESSIMGALVQTAVLGLDPNPDFQLVYYVPRRNRNTNQTELEFKLGYRGLKEIVLRNPQITRIDTDIVYERDFFQVDKFANPPIIHKPDYFGDRGEPVGVYAVAIYRGEIWFEVLTKADAMDAKNRSDAKTSEYSPWNAKEKSIQLEMWKKTAFRRLCKLLPVSLQKGAEIDDAIIPETAIRTNNGVTEIEYSEVETGVEYEPQNEVETAPYEIPQEAAKTVTETNKSDKVLSDASLKRVIDGDLFWNKKVYKGGGQFGYIFVNAKDAPKGQDGMKVIIQTAEQAEELAKLIPEKKEEPAPSKRNGKEDDLPF